MLSNKLKLNRDLLEKVLSIIEEEVHNEKSPKEISWRLQKEIVSYDYLCNVFNQTMPYSIIRYIKRRALTAAYLKWSKEPTELKYRDSFNGINRFSTRFKEEFGLVLQEAIEKHYTEEDLQPMESIDAIEKILTNLDEAPFIEKYTIDNNHVTVQIDSTNLLIHALQMDIFYIPEPILSQFKGDDDDKAALLVMLTESIKNDCTLIKMTLDTFEAKLEMAKMALLNTAIQSGILVIMAPKLPELFDKFCELFTTYTEVFKTTLPLEYIHPETAEKLTMISDAKSVDEISYYLKVTNEKALDLLWEYCKIGLLRIT